MCRRMGRSEVQGGKGEPGPGFSSIIFESQDATARWIYFTKEETSSERSSHPAPKLGFEPKTTFPEVREADIEVARGTDENWALTKSPQSLRPSKHKTSTTQRHL